MTHQALSADRHSFVERFGAVFEHSPWIAEQAFTQISERDIAPASLHEVFRKVVMHASTEQQLELLRAHPELACALAAPTQLTTASREEQAGAGLDRCSIAELNEFSRLNKDYREKFGFPFIVAVRGLSRQQILAQFLNRLGNTADTEFRLALEQVCKIGGFRLEAMLSE